MIVVHFYGVDYTKYPIFAGVILDSTVNFKKILPLTPNIIGGSKCIIVSLVYH